MGNFSVDNAFRLDPDHPPFSKDSTWISLFDELREGRPKKGQNEKIWRRETNVRGLVFAPPLLNDNQPEPHDVVQVHLEHKLIKRLLGPFISQGFQEGLDRVAAITSDVAQPRVVLIGRLALFGIQARRLHEEMITIAAPWHDRDRHAEPLKPYGETGEETTLERLNAALRVGHVPNDRVLHRFQSTAEDDVAQLRKAMETRARAARGYAEKQLKENGQREATAIEGLLRRQVKRVEEAVAAYIPPQLSLDLRTDEERVQDEKERRQREADRATWDEKLARLRHDAEEEPKRVIKSYQIHAERLEPVGLVYLWPRTN